MIKREVAPQYKKRDVMLNKAAQSTDPFRFAGGKVGFWYSAYEPDLPKPEAGVWDEEEKSAVVKYLKAGSEGDHYRGWSDCRVCGCMNGSVDLTDGLYIWPQGLAHYIEEHSIKLPVEFVDYVLARCRQQRS